VSGPLVPRIRRSPTAGAFLDGVNAASLALMVVVTYQLGRSALVDIPTIALALTGAVILFRNRVNSAWVVLGGATAGLASLRASVTMQVVDKTHKFALLFRHGTMFKARFWAVCPYYIANRIAHEGQRA